jgi:Family of unknown function (DUF6962)
VTFVPSETERSTAATDALLGLVSLALAVVLITTPTSAVWKRNIWVGVLLLTSCGSLLGAVAHGIVLRDAVLSALWKPLYLSLGLAVALVFVGAARDWWGEPVAQLMLPWAIAAALAFFAASQLLGGAFVLFIVYEGVATTVALVIYVTLAIRGVLPGASAIAAGIFISLVAAVVQVSSLRLRVGVTFDHNGLFHLIQTVGITVMTVGVRSSMVRG